MNNIIEDIRELRIQGAERIATAGITLLGQVAKECQLNEFSERMEALRKDLIAARPTEPCLFNALAYCVQKNREETLKRVEGAISHFEEAEKKIAAHGARKIKNGMKIFTHCHSTTVVGILKLAWEGGKSFQVYNTETRPKFQGRLTAEELSSLGIEVHHMVDSAARLGLKKADMALFGCDAITSEGKVANKIGTELIAEAAQRLSTPVYVCTDSWKFDPKTIYGEPEPIEERKKEEVWENPPKGVIIQNPAFELVDPGLIAGIISELGVMRPSLFLEEVRHAYPWMW